MNGLINNLTKFITISLELYSPLPYQFTIDLHTLNAYLRSYEQKQQQLLEGFVNRLADKLAAKTRSNEVKEEHNESGQGCLEQVLRHYNSCAIKFPELKLDLPTQNFQRSINQDSKANSFRSDTSKNDGIKPNRHKFATRNKAKQLKMMDADCNKQNMSVVANMSTNRDILQKSQDRSLKFIKSHAQLIMPTYSHALRNISVEANREQNSIKTRPRYESNDNKVYPSQLKIKIKPRTTIDLRRLTENINQITAVLQQNDKEIDILLNVLDYWEQSELLME